MSRSLARVAPVLVLLVAGLTGCIGGSDGDEALSSTADGPAAPGASNGLTGTSAGDGVAGPEGFVRVPLSLADIEPSVNRLTENGTFQGHQFGFPTSAVTGELGLAPESLHTYDVSSLIPRNVPIFLDVQVDADLEEGDLDLWVDAPPAEVWAVDAHAPFGGHTWIGIAFQHVSSDPVTVNVWYDEVEPAETFDYTLSVAAWIDPTLMVPGIPFTVDIPGPGASFEADFPFANDAEGDWDPSAVLVYGPDDEFLGRMTGASDRVEHVFAEDASAGSYVFMVPQGASPARFNFTLPAADGPQAGAAAALTSGILVQDIVQASVDTFTGDPPYAWTFESQRVPLQVGYNFDGAAVQKDIFTTLNAPTGILWEISIEADPWIFPGFGFFTGMGEDGLAAGTYDASLEFTAGFSPEALEVTSWVVHYARP